jgi:hypothetical protein
MSLPCNPAAVFRDVIPRSVDRWYFAPSIGFDECMNRRDLKELGAKLFAERAVTTVVPLWWQLREQANGDRVVGHGSDPPVFPGMGRTVPVPGFSVPDTHVLCQLLYLFFSADKVVFLSENTKRDRNGIRVLLDTVMRPAIDQYHANHFSLVVLMKQRRTSYEAYLAEVERVVREHKFVPGYSYQAV